jgi:hypothetical protein
MRTGEARGPSSGRVRTAVAAVIAPWQGAELVVRALGDVAADRVMPKVFTTLAQAVT